MNTHQENQNISTAIRLIFLKYKENILKNSDNKRFLTDWKEKGDNCYDQWFKFQDSKAFFVTQSMSQLARKQFQGSNCTTCAITTKSAKSIFDSTVYEQEVYFHRGLANETTIVHELLHFFTHRKFDETVNASVNEAVTEYFTRKVLQRAGDKPKQGGFDIAGRQGRYDDQHNAILSFRKVAKDDGLQEEKHYFKKAYFEGDVKCCQMIMLAGYDSILSS